MSVSPAKSSAYLSFEPVDEVLAQTMSMIIEQAGLIAVSLPRDESAAHREILSRTIESSELVIAIWTNNSVTSPWLIDEAEIGARRGVLLSIVVGTREPIGVESIARVLVRKNGVLSSVLAGEAIVRCCEELGYREVRRLWPVKLWSPHTLDAALLIATVALMTAFVELRSSSGWNSGSWVLMTSLFAPAALATRWIFVALSLKLGLPFRAYFRRLFVRWLGESLGAPAVLTVVMALVGKFPRAGEFWLMFFSLFLVSSLLMAVRMLPLILQKKWRLSLLA
jgi:hypothetical protein